MKTHDANFSSRPTYLSAEILSYNYSSVATAPYGEYLRRVRRIYSAELLSAKRVQSFRPIREGVFSELIRWISSRSEEGTVVNLTEKLYSATCEVISRAALGEKADIGKDELMGLIRRAFGFVTGFGLSDSMKWFRFGNSTKRRKLEKLHKEIDVILEGIIVQYRRRRRGRTTTDDNNDDSHRTAEKKQHEVLLDVLFKFQDGDGVELPLTNDNIKAILMEVLSGAESTSTELTWAVAETLRNPRILKKAQDEVIRVFDHKGFVDESNLHELEYLKAIVKETLRMHVPLLGPRTCEIDGYVIPAKATVMVNAWAINRDPKHWGEDADIFKPERFLDSSMDYKGNHFEYIPFGAGRRMCPGISLGLSNIELPLAMLLYHFDWDMPSNRTRLEDLDMTEKFSVTGGMKNDLLLVPKARLPQLISSLITC